MFTTQATFDDGAIEYWTISLDVLQTAGAGAGGAHGGPPPAAAGAGKGAGENGSKGAGAEGGAASSRFQGA